MAMNQVSDAQSLTDQITAILDTHHQYMRTEMPKLAKAVAESKLPKTPEAFQFVGDFDLLNEDISAHLMKEERVLFPMIVELARARAGGYQPRTVGCGVDGPVNQMEFEHAAAKEVIARMEQGIAMLGLQGQVPTLLAAIKADLYEHIRKEEEELFPAAVKLWREAMG